jgi:hypothetical protein
VAPDSVRVWRGFRRKDLSEDEFFQKLGSLFVPASVQIQSKVGLTAYLPTVLPCDKPPAVPDEIALVFYQYRKAYDEAKETVGGRAYSELHELVFDLKKSQTGFPQKFTGTLVPGERYHLFDKRVDWQAGQVKVFVGVRSGEDVSGFLRGIEEWLREVQDSGDSALDGAIVAASEEYVVYWEHWPNQANAERSAIPRLGGRVQAVYHESIPAYTLTDGLWDVCPGLEVKGGESFNFQFPRGPLVAPHAPQRSPSIAPEQPAKSGTEKPLEAYNTERFGPLLGVSNEGSAAKTIVDAAYASAKARAYGPGADAMCVGMIMDGERITSAGEVPVGPDEYECLVPVARCKTFCTTNVGVRVNAHFDLPLPEFRVADAAIDEAAWLEAIYKRFDPFIHTPDKKPRRLTVRLLFQDSDSLAPLGALVSKLEAGREAGRIGPRDLHRLSCLLVFKDAIASEAQIGQIRTVIHEAAALGVPEVAVDGAIHEPAKRRLSAQGLLNVLDPGKANELLGEARSSGVSLTYRFELDEDSAARTVWTGLYSAYRQGLTAAKYGLTPLTLAQQEHVVRQNQCWLSDWTAIPAFYVDTPLVTETGVYQSDRCPEAAQLWLEMVASLGAKVVLVDAPDRVDPRKLLRSGDPNEHGVLSIDQVKTLSQCAKRLGLRVLWSGGIRADQVFQLAKLHVDGIFTTSSAAAKVAVHGPLVSDPQLDAAVEPTETGIRRIHALIQAGFLCSALARSNAEIVEGMEGKAAALIACKPDSKEAEPAIAALDELLIQGWKRHWE